MYNPPEVVFDLDGVCRDLLTYFNLKYDMPIPDSWNFKYLGRDIFKWVKFDDFKVLTRASGTPYLEVIQEVAFSKLKYPIIWTSQPFSWRKHAISWLEEHFICYDVKFMSSEAKEQQLKKNKNILLIEDSPNFKNYDRVVLIDMPYNKGIKCYKRVSTAQELREVINLWLEG